MITVTKYVAEDGTEFVDEDECFEYEKKVILTKYADKIILLDSNLNRLPITSRGDLVYVIFTEDKDAALAFWHLRQKEDFYSPWDQRCFYNPKNGTFQLGAFLYDIDSEEWMSLKERLEEYRYYQDVASILVNIMSSH